MKTDYLSIQITQDQAKKIARELYRIEGESHSLAGELDFNFRIKTKKDSYILKISRPDVDEKFVEFQQQILEHVSKSGLPITSPLTLHDVNGKFISHSKDNYGNKRIVRMLSWIGGRLWSSVHPQNDELLFSLGEQAGLLTKALQDFDHPHAHRKFEWDIARVEWTNNFVHLFNNEQNKIISNFQHKFDAVKDKYQTFRKSVVHNDVNNNNIVVTNDLINPKVISIIDYGDAIYTQTINDLAIAIAYAVMNKTDALRASLPIIKGYHKHFPIQEKELDLLFVLVAMRLVISVTKSAINKQKEPDNKYLLVSEKPAWKVLEKWIQINEDLARYSFREACGFRPHPDENAFTNWANKQSVSLKGLFPKLNTDKVQFVDMSISSRWLGNEAEFNDTDMQSLKIKRLQKQNPHAIIGGGYLEPRPFYSTDAFKKEGNNGPEFRTFHLGMDFWMADLTPIHAIFDGTVFSIINNDIDKDYGPTLLLKHKADDGTEFFSLYGHLSKSTLQLHQRGQSVQKGDLIAYVGNSNENGNWAPHLHFQLMLDMLGNKHNFPGVAFPEELKVWKSICPDPNLLFKHTTFETQQHKTDSESISFRKRYLGKSLSLSYNEPLKIERGTRAHLIDNTGRKYLDTVNNVAHVGHEHHRVVKSGQDQMAVLNTNTRYLHGNINEFARELLGTFPEELSVVYFVNSGSEANELALRMTRVYTGQKEMIAVEVGYHGNTSGCIDISSYKFDGEGGQGAPEHTHIVPLPDAYRGMYRGKNTGPKYAEHIKKQIKNIQQKGRNIAGFICESIISCGGQIELPNDYLKIAYQAVRSAGGLCLADEVQVGCGRVGSHFWGFELHDVVPDIVTIGKPIGNGHPLAAVVCTREVADAFANGMEYFNTFGGNPVSCAIGLEVLRVIKDEKLQENALAVGNYMKKGLLELQKNFPIIGEVRGQGLFLGFELNDENKNPLTKKATYLANRMKELAILMSTDGKHNNVLKIKPPMVFSVENAMEFLFRLKTVFKEDFMRH